MSVVLLQLFERLQSTTMQLGAYPIVIYCSVLLYYSCLACRPYNYYTLQLVGLRVYWLSCEDTVWCRLERYEIGTK